MRRAAVFGFALGIVASPLLLVVAYVVAHVWTGAGRRER